MTPKASHLHRHACPILIVLAAADAHNLRILDLGASFRASRPVVRVIISNRVGDLTGIGDAVATLGSLTEWTDTDDGEQWFVAGEHADFELVRARDTTAAAHPIPGSNAPLT
jgi:hypothetical protein